MNNEIFKDLPKGTLLYRGGRDPDYLSSKQKQFENPIYFSLNPVLARAWGRVMTYLTKRKLTVLSFLVDEQSSSQTKSYKNTLKTYKVDNDVLEELLSEYAKNVGLKLKLKDVLEVFRLGEVGAYYRTKFERTSFYKWIVENYGVDGVLVTENKSMDEVGISVWLANPPKMVEKIDDMKKYRDEHPTITQKHRMLAYVYAYPDNTMDDCLFHLYGKKSNFSIYTDLYKNGLLNRKKQGRQFLYSLSYKGEEELENILRKTKMSYKKLINYSE